MVQSSAPQSRNIERALDRAGYLVMVGGCSFPQPHWHWHSGIEISLIHTGAANVSMQNWRATLLSGDAVVGQAEVAHAAEGTFSRTVLHFRPDLVPGQHHDLIRRITDSDGGLAFSPDPDVTARLLWVAHELDRVQSSNGHLPTVQALFGLALADVQVSLERQKGRLPSGPVRAVVYYMHSNPESGETVEELGERFSISRSHLACMFAEHLGTSPGEYWLKIRLEHACRLLASGTSVQRVATRVGFHSLRGFQRAFQRYYSMSPAQYRSLAYRRQSDGSLAAVD